MVFVQLLINSTRKYFSENVPLVSIVDLILCNMLQHSLLNKTNKIIHTSIIAITHSLFVRRTCITFSQVERKLPSIPLTSIAFTSILVNRKGTWKYIHIYSEYVWKRYFKDIARGTSQCSIYLLRELLPVHRGLKAVPKIDVQDFSAVNNRIWDAPKSTNDKSTCFQRNYQSLLTYSGSA